MDLPQDAALLDSVRELAAARPLFERLSGAHNVFLVGGAVRDLLRGERPSDLDLVVEGDAGALARTLDGEVVVHDRFGTSTVSFGGFSYDIARTRSETYSEPGALPDVTPASLDEDLIRRDFTVNAIAIALTNPGAGAITAAPGALADLDARLLRVFHPRSFTDDPTRLLRLARYHARLGFAIEALTAGLVEQALAAGALGTVSGPRIGAELRLAAREADPVGTFAALRQLAIDRAVHPGFGIDDEIFARRALELLPDDGRRDRLVLAEAARGVPAVQLRPLLEGLEFEAEDRDTIFAAATRAGSVASALASATMPSEIAAATTGAAPELVALAGALGPEEQAQSWLGRLRHVALAINGDDLLRAGIPEGPAIGRGLAAALAAKLDGHADGPAEELSVALGAARATG